MKIEGLVTRFDMFDKFYEDLDKEINERYPGLYIDKSTKPQTICQIVKNIIKPLFGGRGVYGV